MRNFAWKKIYELDRVSGEKKFISFSIIEILALDNAAMFWGSVGREDDSYRICAYDSRRHLKTVNEKFSELDDAMEAIEDYLVSESIITEEELEGLSRYEQGN